MGAVQGDTISVVSIILSLLHVEHQIKIERYLQRYLMFPRTAYIT